MALNRHDPGLDSSQASLKRDWLDVIVNSVAAFSYRQCKRGSEATPFALARASPWRTQFRMLVTWQPNSLASSPGFLPARTSSIICSRNCAGYGGLGVCGLLTSDSFCKNNKVSVKWGQLHNCSTVLAASSASSAASIASCPEKGLAMPYLQLQRYAYYYPIDLEME